ncbi:MAG: hypothetical protein M1815_004521 [Lichina confinis]|nr:MAG: hypothetical protein M1815_004521 [Lichina confinis]
MEDCARKRKVEADSGRKAIGSDLLPHNAISLNPLAEQLRQTGHNNSPPHKFRRRRVASRELKSKGIEPSPSSQNDIPFETKRRQGLSRVGAPMRPNTRSQRANEKGGAQSVPETSPASPSSATRQESDYDNGAQEGEEITPRLSAVVEEESDESYNGETEEQYEMSDRVDESQITLRNEGDSNNDSEGEGPEHQQHTSPSAKPPRESDDTVEGSAAASTQESDDEDDRKSLAGYTSCETLEIEETLRTRDADLWDEKSLLRSLMRNFDDHFEEILPLESVSAIRIAELISEIRGRFEDAIEKADGVEGLTEKMRTSLEHLKTMMDEVINKRRDEKSEKMLVVEFYAQLIPRLVRLLYRAWQFHGATNGSSFKGPEQLIEVTRLILRCYERVRKPPASMIRGKGIVKPVKNCVVVPIRRLQKNLIRILDRRRREEKKQDEQKRLEEARRRREAQRKRRRRNNEQRIADRERLAEMTIERELRLSNRESAIPRRHASRELSAREEHILREVDAFRSESAQDRRYPSHPTAESPRSRPGPQRLAKCLGSWSAIEAKALVKALERHADGTDRYQRIVDDECCVGGVLEGRNMDDIIDQAKYFRTIIEADYDTLSRSGSRSGSGSRSRLKCPPPWITNIVLSE